MTSTVNTPLFKATRTGQVSSFYSTGCEAVVSFRLVCLVVRIEQFSSRISCYEPRLVNTVNIDVVPIHVYTYTCASVVANKVHTAIPVFVEFM